MISWTLTTATEDDTTTATGTTADRASATTELLDATREATLNAATRARPVHTLTLDGEWIATITTGDTADGAPDRDLTLQRIADLETKIVDRGRATDTL